MPAAGYAAAGLVLSGISAVMGFLGGREQDRTNRAIAEAQYDMAVAKHNFNWQEAQDQYWFSRETNDINYYNLERTRTYQKAQAINEWIDKDKVRLFDYANQIDAYNASLTAMDQQLGFNNQAAALATNVHKRAYQDDLDKIGYQIEDIQMQQEQQRIGTGIKRDGVRAELRAVVRETRTARDQFKANLSRKKAEIKSKIRDAGLKSLADEGKIKSVGQAGRSVRKSLTANIAGYAALQKDYITALYSEETAGQLDIKRVNEKLLAAGDKLDINDRILMEDLFNTRVETEFGKEQLNRQLRSINLEYEAGKEKQKLDKYDMDLRAREMVAPRPILAPELSRPLEAPEPMLQIPRMPREGPEPTRYAASTGHGLAGLAGGLGTIASAVGTYAKYA